MNKKLVYFVIVLLAFGIGMASDADAKQKAAKKETASEAKNSDSAAAPEQAFPAYPGSVKEKYQKEGAMYVVYYTNDPVEKVKAFFASQKKPDASIDTECGPASTGASICTEPEAGKAIKDLKDCLSMGRICEQVHGQEVATASRKYQYLTQVFFPLSAETRENEHLEVPDVLYAKYVGDADKAVEVSERNQEEKVNAMGASLGAGAEKQEKGKKSGKKKKKKSDDDDDAMTDEQKMAQAMEMMQGMSQDTYKGTIEAQQNTGKVKEKRGKTYISFLQELAKQTSYKTRITIALVQQREYTSETREAPSVKSPGAAVNKLKGLFGK